MDEIDKPVKIGGVKGEEDLDDEVNLSGSIPVMKYNTDSEEIYKKIDEAKRNAKE